MLERIDTEHLVRAQLWNTSSHAEGKTLTPWHHQLHFDRWKVLWKTLESRQHWWISGLNQSKAVSCVFKISFYSLTWVNKLSFLMSFKFSLGVQASAKFRKIHFSLLPFSTCSFSFLPFSVAPVIVTYKQKNQKALNTLEYIFKIAYIQGLMWAKIVWDGLVGSFFQTLLLL